MYFVLLLVVKSCQHVLKEGRVGETDIISKLSHAALLYFVILHAKSILIQCYSVTSQYCDWTVCIQAEGILVQGCWQAVGTSWGLGMAETQDDVAR